MGKSKNGGDPATTAAAKAADTSPATAPAAELSEDGGSMAEAAAAAETGAAPTSPSSTAPDESPAPPAPPVAIEPDPGEQAKAEADAAEEEARKAELAKKKADAKVRARAIGSELQTIGDPEAQARDHVAKLSARIDNFKRGMAESQMTIGHLEHERRGVSDTMTGKLHRKKLLEEELARLNKLIG